MAEDSRRFRSPDAAGQPDPGSAHHGAEGGPRPSFSPASDRDAEREELLRVFELEVRAVRAVLSSARFRKQLEEMVHDAINAQIARLAKMVRWATRASVGLITVGAAVLTLLGVQAAQIAALTSSVAEKRRELASVDKALQERTDMISKDLLNLRESYEQLLDRLSSTRGEYRVVAEEIATATQTSRRIEAMEVTLNQFARNYADTLDALRSRTARKIMALDLARSDLDARVTNAVDGRVVPVEQKVQQIDKVLGDRSRYVFRSTNDLTSLTLDQDGKDVQLGPLTVRLRLAKQGLVCTTQSRRSPGANWNDLDGAWQKLLGPATPGAFYLVYDHYYVEVTTAYGPRCDCVVGLVAPSAD